MPTKPKKKSRAKPAAVTKTNLALRNEAKKKLPYGSRAKLNGGNSTSTKKKRASTSGGPGKRVVDQKNWRKKLQTSKIKFDDVQKSVFLNTFAETGRLGESASAADVSTVTVRNHLEADPEFSEAYDNAKLKYREERVHKVVERVALEGVLEPIVGGKNRDEIVAHKRIFATNILAMEMKRVDPAYREKGEIDVNVKSGVIVMPATISEEEWIKRFSLPVPDSGETIEHEE